MAEPTTCVRCGAPLVRQTDRRKAAGYSLRCSVGGHSRPGRGPRGETLARTRARRAPRAGRPPISQRWLTDPTVRVCTAEGCMADAGTCRHARTKGTYAETEQPSPE